jgi:hypothetical protein
LRLGRLCIAAITIIVADLRERRTVIRTTGPS